MTGFFGARMVVVVDGRALAAEMLGRGAHAPLELVVVVAVEQIVLAIVLVLDHGFDRAQTLLEKAALRLSILAGTVGVAAPAEVSLGKIAARFPALLVDKRLQARSVSAGFRTEDAIGGTASSLLRVGAPLFPPRVSARMRAAIILSASSSSSAPTARTALSKSAICSGKASRKKPEIRKVTSTRGRPRTASGMISYPVTRREAMSQTGFAPISAKAWAISSPPVRMLEVPQAVRPKEDGHSPWSCR